MQRRWILTVALIAFSAMAARGVCREPVRRPVVRFIDFYVAAGQAERPLSFFERVAFGLAIAVEQPPPPVAPAVEPCV